MTIVNGMNKKAIAAFEDMSGMLSNKQLHRRDFQKFAQRHNTPVVDRKIPGVTVDLDGVELFTGATEDNPVEALVVAMPTLCIPGGSPHTEFNVLFRLEDGEGYTVECVRAVEMQGGQQLTSLLSKSSVQHFVNLTAKLRDAVSVKSPDGDWEDPK